MKNYQNNNKITSKILRPLGKNQDDHRLSDQSFWQSVHLDVPLLLGLLLLIIISLIILYSAGQAQTTLLFRQAIRFALAFLILLGFAQIPPTKLQHISPWLYLGGLSLLIAVMLMGVVGKGAQRWLDFGIIRFQPSEIMKLAIPVFLAAYFDTKHLPPRLRDIAFASIVILIPVLVTAKQPDLGTALMLAFSGACVLFLAGTSWVLIIATGSAAALSAPVIWHFMHDYQRLRVLTFLNPENDPLGAGYHIIQSKIAIGSGGMFGKGWLNGTQSHLDFLPEDTTDFIFAVCGEEFGLIGGVTLILIYLFIAGRGFYLSTQAQDTFGRLLAGSLSLVFFFSAFINIGMVSGLLPVVGLPLPLVSYGGTSMLTLMASFGLIMSIHTHRKLVAH